MIPRLKQNRESTGRPLCRSEALRRTRGGSTTATEMLTSGAGTITESMITAKQLILPEQRRVQDTFTGAEAVSVRALRL